MTIKAIRGAITVSEDSKEEVTARTELLLKELLSRNSLVPSKVVSIFFTATNDISSVAPALAARQSGFGDVPLLCAQEMHVAGSMERVIRVFLHVESSAANTKVNHVFLGGATALRPELALPGDSEV